MNESKAIPDHPSFSSLPLDSNGPPGNAWGLFGPNDQLGMLNRLTPETIVEAAKEIKTGTRFSLDWPLNKPSYPSFGRNPCEHKLVNRGGRVVNDDVLHFNTQCSSQWDGFRHYGFLKSRQYYNGTTHEDLETSDALGIHSWLEKGGITGRGVLLDYPEWAERNGVAIDALSSTPILLAHLKRIISDQNIVFRSGDILLIRSGFSAAYNKLNLAEQKALSERESPDFIGLEAGKETLQWLWEQQFAAVASDAPSFERAPIAGPHADLDHMLHQWLIAGWGMPIGEMFDLEDLAKYCQTSGRTTFFLSSMPLRVPGGVASPPNAVAIF